MTDDDKLIERIRPLLVRRKGFSEKRMFGGVCFLINGNMCAGTWKGSLVVRLDKNKHEEILKERYTKPFDATGKVVKGWASPFLNVQKRKTTLDKLESAF